MERLRASLAEYADVRVHVSDNFTMLSDLRTEAVSDVLCLADHALVRVADLFPDIDFRPPHGQWPLLLFEDRDIFMAYYSNVMPAGSVSMIPGGVWISGPGQLSHFLIPYSAVDTLDGALAHELIHAALDRLPTPLWLEEGLAMSVECALGHRMHPFASYDAYTEIKAYFSEHDPVAVLRANDFKDPMHGEYLYKLSQLMVACLLRDRVRFSQFIQSSCVDDQGESALRDVYNYDLAALARSAITPDAPRSWFSRLVYQIFGYA